MKKNQLVHTLIVTAILFSFFKANSQNAIGVSDYLMEDFAERLRLNWEYNSSFKTRYYAFLTEVNDFSSLREIDICIESCLTDSDSQQKVFKTFKRYGQYFNEDALYAIFKDWGYNSKVSADLTDRIMAREFKTQADILKETEEKEREERLQKQLKDEYFKEKEHIQTEEIVNLKEYNEHLYSNQYSFLASQILNYLEVEASRNSTYFRYNNIYDVQYKKDAFKKTISLVDNKFYESYNTPQTRSDIRLIKGTDAECEMLNSIIPPLPDITVKGKDASVEFTINNALIDYAKGKVNVFVKKGKVLFEKKSNVDDDIKGLIEVEIKSYRRGKYKVEFLIYDVLGDKNVDIQAMSI